MTPTSDIIFKGRFITKNPTEFIDKLETLITDSDVKFEGTVYRYEFTGYEDVTEDEVTKETTQDEEKDN